MASHSSSTAEASSQAIRIAAIYALIGSLWILLTTGILTPLVSRMVSFRDLPWGQTASGMLVVLASALILYRLVFGRLSDAREAAHALRLRDRAIASSTNAIVIISHGQGGGLIEYANPALTRITGYPLSEVCGRPWSFLFSDAEEQPSLENLTGALREQREGRALLSSHRKSGEQFWSDFHLAPVNDENGCVTHFIGVLNDVSESVRYQKELEFQANHDTLTGLPNRNLLQDRVSQAIESAKRYQRCLTVVFIDLDNFKWVNDSLGHQAGDQLLKMVAARLRSCVRSSDTVARMGGDEFVLLLCDRPVDATDDNAYLTSTLQRILAEIAIPYCIGGQEFFISCSIGYCSISSNTDTAELLLKHADMAMYRAKEMGRNNIQPYVPELHERVARRLKLEGDLRRALDNNEFFLCYQPQIDLQSHRVIGMETLIRWAHPERGLISPVQFIPVAEETGLINEIGTWVLRTACAQAKAWQDAGLPRIVVSVNISARQFMDRDLVIKVRHALEDSGLPANCLELELTESLIMHNAELFISTLSSLRALGVELAVDDFGTGYSSLSYLHRFPINRLKIDQSFIRDLTNNADCGAISTAIITLGHSLGLKVIAEGVESVEQVEFLRARACNEIQGYYFSKPLPSDEMAKYLALSQVT